MSVSVVVAASPQMLPLATWLPSGLTPAGVLSAALAGLAAFWWIRNPRRAWLRLAPRGQPRVGHARWSRLLRGRADAPSMPRRLAVSGTIALALGLGASTWGGGPGPLGWLAVPVLGLGGAVGLGWLEPTRARRRQQRLVLEAPQALELLAAGLAAGLPIRTACAAVMDVFDGPVAEDLGRVLAGTALGVSEADAWRVLAAHPQFGGAAVDLARSVESGTMMVEGLRHHAEVARERRRAAQQVRARAVGVRSVLPLMICFIPSFMLLGVVPTVISAVTHALS